jgi:hypothetical protein
MAKNKKKSKDLSAQIVLAVFFRHAELKGLHAQTKQNRKFVRRKM